MRQASFFTPTMAPRPPAPPRVEASPPNPLLAKIATILTNARFPKDGKRGLLYPVIRFATPDDSQFRISLAGAESRNPGSVHVSTSEKAFADRTYFGRIDFDGEFYPGRGQEGAATAIVAVLEAFATDPEGQARQYGRRYNVCCYCGITLTNAKSIDLGYGPICAGKFGGF